MTAPVAEQPDPVSYDANGQYFRASRAFDFSESGHRITSPLSVILQVTRRCNLACSFCSETTPMDDPTLEELDLYRQNLRGVRRVFLSGGEPLLREDFPRIAEMYSQDFIVGLPTNATPARRTVEQLLGRVAFVNIGLEGPRAITNQVRGNFDQIIQGVFTFREVGLPISFTAVLLRSAVGGMRYTYQIADLFSARKLKLIMPIRKGSGLSLPESEFISEEEADGLFDELVAERNKYGWMPSLRMTTWTPSNEGYSILVYPNGKTYAWPVYGAEDKVTYLGDLHEQTIQEIWTSYPYKRHHLDKYLGRSIRISDEAGIASRPRERT